MKKQDNNPQMIELIREFRLELDRIEEDCKKQMAESRNSQSCLAEPAQFRNIHDKFFDLLDTLGNNPPQPNAKSMHKWLEQTRDLQLTLNESINKFLFHHILKSLPAPDFISSPSFLETYGVDVAPMATAILHKDNYQHDDEFIQAVFLKTAVFPEETDRWAKINENWEIFTEMNSSALLKNKPEATGKNESEHARQKIKEIFTFILTGHLLDNHLSESPYGYSVGTEDYNHLIVDSAEHAFQANIVIFAEEAQTADLLSDYLQVHDSLEFIEATNKLRARVESTLTEQIDLSQIRFEVEESFKDQTPEEWLPVHGFCFPHIFGKSIYFQRPLNEVGPETKDLKDWLQASCTTRLEKIYEDYIDHITNEISDSL